MKSFSFFLYGLLVAGPALAAGGWSSSGNDVRASENGAAWFLGSEPVAVCVELNPGFGKSTAEVQEVFLQAARTWKEYLAAKHIDTRRPSQGNVDLSLNLNFRFLSTCDGSEDLKLYMGVENAEVQAEKAHYDQPFAFAVRRTYDKLAGRGKGFIWFAQTKSVFPKAGDGFPDWTKPYTLLGVMLHELGHVLGCGHVDGTIMKADLMGDIQFMDSPDFSRRGAAMLSRIDDFQLLYHTEFTPFDYGGFITYNNYRPEEVATTFEYVMGRKPMGKVTARYFREEFSKPRFLEIRDERGSERFEIHVVPDSESEYEGNDNLFRVTRATGETNGVVEVGSSHMKTGFTQLGWINGKGKAKNVSILISENMNDLSRPFHLRYLKDGRAWDLFNSRLPGMQD